jgi:hypothetical protein
MIDKDFEKKFGDKFRFSVLAGCSYSITCASLRGDRNISKIFIENAEKNLEKTPEKEIEIAAGKLRKKILGHNKNKNIVQTILDDDTKKLLTREVNRVNKSSSEICSTAIRYYLQNVKK